MELDILYSWYYSQQQAPSLKLQAVNVQYVQYTIYFIKISK